MTIFFRKENNNASRKKYTKNVCLHFKAHLSKKSLIDILYRKQMCLRKYNLIRRGDFIMKKEDFVKRLRELRHVKGVSARAMSLAIGQSPNYINSIERSRNLPSMKVFFAICKYLNIMPEEFFDMDVGGHSNINELKQAVKHLNSNQIDMLIRLLKP